MSRKVFTAGEVLAAADVNSFLMDQTVMSFAGTAARGSAIPSPVEGMYTHLEDTDRLEFWNGSAWQSPAGMTLINSTSFTAQSVVDITNVFTSEFENYKVIVAANLTTVATAALYARLLASGTASTASYQGVRLAYNLGTGSLQNTVVETNLIPMGWMPAANYHISTMELTRPFSAANTAFSGSFSGDASGAYASGGIYFGGHQVATSYNGLRIATTSSNMTGSIRIYGLRNA
jgi:hypothetical protein